VLELKSEYSNSTKHINYKNLYHLANNDKAFVKEMLQVFIKTTSEDLIKIKSCLSEHDWIQLADYIHKIKSPCKHLDANKLAEKLEQIENYARNNNDGNQTENTLKEMINSTEFQLKELMREVEKYLETNFAEIT